MMPAVRAVADSFDRLRDHGRHVSLWWRDDDVTEPTRRLERLLAIARDARVPIAFAAIPAEAGQPLAERLAGEDAVAVLVHGWAHANHAPFPEKPAEFGPGRSEAAMTAEAARALRQARTVFGDALRPVFVPPWNRIAPEATGSLGALGYRALSCFGEAQASGPGLPRLDTHLDPVDWPGGRGLLPPAALAAQLNRALARGAERIGVLTHHLMFDDELFGFSAELAGLAAGHPAVRVRSIDDLLTEAEHTPSPGSAPLLAGVAA